MTRRRQIDETFDVNPGLAGKKQCFCLLTDKKRCRRISYGSVFVFVSDLHPCYKIAFEKQGVRPSTVWWR